MIVGAMKPSAELWEKTLSAIKKSLNDREYNTWFENRLSLMGWDKADGLLYLGVDSDIHKGKAEYKYAQVIEAAACEAFGSPLKIRYLLPGEQIPKKTKAPKDQDALPPGKIFNPRYTFENFILGDNNRYAAGAAQKVAENPGNKKFSPLFIYGKSGLGKTHLLNAIGIDIIKKFPEIEVLYVTSEAFTDDFVNASLDKSLASFKKRYRMVDVLLIDDLQFISGKIKTIEEVFNTYEALYGLGKQMVFTADRTPREISGLDERLVSRLSSGTLVDLQQPLYETKVAILKNYAILEGLPMNDRMSEVIQFIAETVKSNVRELEGAFNSVIAYADVFKTPLTKNLAKQILKDTFQLTGSGLSAKDVKKVVASHFGIPVAAIDSEERTRALSTPRQIAMYLCRELTTLSFPKIAEVFKKDYATVHYAYDKIKKEIAVNEDMRNIVSELKEKLQSEY